MASNGVDGITREWLTIRFRWVRPLHMINIVGTMGSGKTTLLRRLYSEFRRGRRGVTSIYFQYDKDKAEEFWETVRSVEAAHVFVAIDDISFSLTRGDREFLHRLSKIRHMNPRVKRWAVATSMHYSRATLPFLRQAATKILTSLNDPEEIENLKWTFTTQALWDYYYTYTAYPTEHFILVNWLGQIFITRFTKPRRHARCWDIVVNGPRCV